MHPQSYPPPPAKKSNLALIIILVVVGAVVVLGVLAAVAIPSFLDYSKKAKKSEAELNLDAIQKGLKRRQGIEPGFPVGDTGETPAGSCCDSPRPDKKCEPDPSLWAGNPIWDELSFDVSSPHYFRYRYVAESPDHFTAHAIGDLDCDGNEVEYVLEGTMEQGRPVFEVTKPARTD